MSGNGWMDVTGPQPAAITWSTAPQAVAAAKAPDLPFAEGDHIVGPYDGHYFRLQTGWIGASGIRYADERMRKILEYGGVLHRAASLEQP